MVEGAAGAGPVANVTAIPKTNRCLQELRHGFSLGPRLLANKAIITDVAWMRRVAQVVNFCAPTPPAFVFLIGNEVGDTGIAFPPVLVSRGETGDDCAYMYWLGWICELQNLIRLVPQGTKQLGFDRA